MLTLGVDVGGSKLLACLVDERGAVRARAQAPTGRATGPALIVDRIARLVDTIGRDGHRPDAIGVGFPGLVDRAARRVHSSVMLDGWRDVPLADLVAEACGVPCTVDNDVNVAAIRELSLRLPQEPDEAMLFVAVGTGIGGAIAWGGRVHRGAVGVAGEIGNTTIDRDGEVCWCGRRGCLNTLASGSAIERAAGLAPGTLAEAWQAPAPSLIAAVDRAADALGVGLANAVQLLAPTLVVVGGGVAELGDRWLDGVRRALLREAFREATGACVVERARGGYEAAAYGAAQLARDLVDERPRLVAVGGAS